MPDNLQTTVAALIAAEQKNPGWLKSSGLMPFLAEAQGNPVLIGRLIGELAARGADQAARVFGDRSGGRHTAPVPLLDGTRFEQQLAARCAARAKR